MKKVVAIARSEYLQAVRSKAFLIGLLVMPVLMGGGIAFQVLVGDQVDLRDRACAVVDPTGELWPVLVTGAEERNATWIWEAEEGGEKKQIRPRILLERFKPTEGQRADVLLSQRVEKGELQGFVLIEPEVLAEEPGERPLAYYTEEPSFTELPEWVERAVNDEVHRRRFEGAGMDRELVTKLSRPLSFTTWGLVEERPDGSVVEPEEENKLRSFGVPFAGLMLLFMFVMTAAPQLMNQVLEEKMQRISEVLISAVSPFQLMLGKLLAGVGVSLTLAVIYLAASAFSRDRAPRPVRSRARCAIGRRGDGEWHQFGPSAARPATTKLKGGRKLCASFPKSAHRREARWPQAYASLYSGVARLTAATLLRPRCRARSPTAILPAH